MQQTVNFDVIKQDLNKCMLISMVKIKLMEAKTLMISAEKALDKVIINGSSQDIYYRAYDLARAKDRYGNLKILYQTVCNYKE